MEMRARAPGCEAALQRPGRIDILVNNAGALITSLRGLRMLLFQT